MRETWIGNLRGIAALLVFISHLYIINGTAIGFIVGRIGVVWFFLITGYLSVGSRQKRSGRKYLLNRFIRMYPVYWVLLAIQGIVLVLFKNAHISLRTFLLNMTLFQEFFGLECLIDSSWMMPIQVVFFIGVGILGVTFFSRKLEMKKTSIYISYLIMILLMLLAIVTGIIRNITHRPFPVAFFLLLAVAFLGMYQNLLGETV